MSTEATKKATEYLNIKQGKHLGVGSIAGAGFDVAFSVVGGIKSGQSFGESIIKGTADAAMWAIAPGVMWTAFGASIAGSVGKGIYNYNANLDSRYYERMQAAKSNFNYVDTRQAVTMRQAAVQAIQGSKMNARNALGGEASLMHRTKRIY